MEEWETWDTLAKRVKGRREMINLSQTQLAVGAGIGQGDVSKIERGETLRPRSVVQLAEVLLCDPYWLSRGELKSSGSLRPGPKNPWTDGYTGRRGLRSPSPSPLPSSSPDEVTIDQYEDVGGAMGHGLVLEDKPPGHIRSWKVDNEWLRLNVRHHTGVNNLRIVTGFGPSMRPMFNPGDPLLLDIGVTTVDVDAVYFFRVGEAGFIKILQRVPSPDGIVLRAKSKNADYDPFDITPKMLAQEGYFQVFGKVLTVWKSEVL